jgi:hypothetical protein
MLGPWLKILIVTVQRGSYSIPQRKLFETAECLRYCANKAIKLVTLYYNTKYFTLFLFCNYIIHPTSSRHSAVSNNCTSDDVILCPVTQKILVCQHLVGYLVSLIFYQSKEPHIGQPKLIGMLLFCMLNMKNSNLINFLANYES